MFGTTDARRAQSHPRAVDWFAYKTSVGTAREAVATGLRTELGLDFEPDDIAMTQGAFGTATLTYLVYQRVLESQNVGLGSAGGIYAVILANIIAIFLMRIVGKNLDA
jgi:sorbitol/mannitol transport system permease protein